MNGILQCYNPIDAWYGLYQNYYTDGFSQAMGPRNLHYSPLPKPGSRLLSQVTAKLQLKPLANRALELIRPSPVSDFSQYHPHVGQYIWKDSSQKTVRFAIDAHDKKEIVSPQALEWCDIYFKANLWPSHSYSNKVKPVVNGNGWLDQGNLDRLRELRSSPKEYDLVYITNIMGGRREHDVRIFENLARFKGKKYLRASFPTRSYDSSNLLEFQNRLDKAEVPWSFETFDIHELWKLIASSRLLLVREGKYRCLTWRILDLLCMGSFLIMETQPRPVWPTPLKEGENFVSLGLDRNDDQDLAADSDYEAIPDRLARMLEHPDLETKLHRSNIEYFENHASPMAVAEYMLNTIKANSRAQD